MLSPGPIGELQMRSANTTTAAGSVRIVAGSLRGSKLAVADMDGLRPTPDRVRETLFNWLAPTIAGARCLDLYAGTGALGIEALSRGAAECVFVERDRALCRLLEENLARLKVPAARVVNGEAGGFLAHPESPFDLVFLDPPFAADLWSTAAQQLEQGGWVRESGFVYVESPRGHAFGLPANWVPHRQGHAGAVSFALHRRLGMP
jgi:16S rRNA (guanine966-N2)-methyltransferase